MPIKFGTDGWRALIEQDFTYENVRICTQAVCDYMKKRGFDHTGIIIGYDTRENSESFAKIVAEVTAGNKIPTLLCDQSAPTPTISYNLVSRECGAGIVITASHNSAKWNGFKFKPGYGGSASEPIISALESHLSLVERNPVINSVGFDFGLETGLIELIDVKNPYLNHIASLVDLNLIRNSGLNVVIDSMYGAGSGYFKSLLEGGSLKIKEIRSEFSPTFPGMIQPEPIEKNLKPLKDEIETFNADIGLATDGDADRLGMVDENGIYISTLFTFTLLCQHLLAGLHMSGTIVKSITMTNMIEKLGNIYDCPVIETPVGFKHLGPVFIEENALAAGEESGGYAFRGHIPERDGILSGLLILDMMVKTGKNPNELVSDLISLVGPHHYNRIDFEFEERDRLNLMSTLADSLFKNISGINVTDINTSDGYKYYLEDNSWALVRFSGTEPILRIHAESNTLKKVDLIIKDLTKLLNLS